MNGHRNRGSDGLDQNWKWQKEVGRTQRKIMEGRNYKGNMDIGRIQQLPNSGGVEPHWHILLFVTFSHLQTHANTQ
jgi:hypothetical protein